MLELDLFGVFTTRLNTAEINYIVTGSVAAMVYGEPRMTHDIDLVLELKKMMRPGFTLLFLKKNFIALRLK